MINEVFQKLIDVYGEDEYNRQSANSIRNSIDRDFKNLIKKYNDPGSFDK